jgi:hypothetical protein
MRFQPTEIVRRQGILPALSVAVAVVLIALAAAGSFVKPLGLYDEGFSLTNALRLLHGDVPHRDYWAAYPPGTSLVLAAAFAITEPALWVARVVNLGWTMLLLGAFAVLLSRFAGLGASLAATVIAAFWVSASLYPSYSVTPALGLVFTALALMVVGIGRDSRAITVAGGVVAGLIVLFRHDFSGYLFVSISAALGAAIITAGSDPARIAGMRNTLRFLASFLATTLLVLLVMLAFSGWEDFIDQAIVFPATGMRANRFLPYPGLLEFVGAWKTRWLLAWLAPLVVVTGIVVLRIARADRDFRRSLAIGTVAAMSLLLTLQAHNRLDMPHAAPSMVLATGFLVMLASGMPRAAPRTCRIVAWGLAGVLAGFSLHATAGYLNLGEAWHCIRSPQAAACPRIDSRQTETVDYIRKHYRPHEPVFVGNTRHDRIFVNDASLYFLLDRPIPVRWNEMHPGIVTTREVQQAIVRQLEEGRVDVVVLADMPEPGERNASAASSGVFVLDEYLRDNFRPVFSNARYRVLERQPRTTPRDQAGSGLRGPHVPATIRPPDAPGATRW